MIITEIVQSGHMPGAVHVRLWSVPSPAGPRGGGGGVPGPGQQAHRQGAGGGGGLAGDRPHLPRDEGQPSPRDGDPGRDVGRQA